jgi:hypothetical protein
VSTTKERVDELLDELRASIEELREASLARIEEARKSAESQISRYEAAAGELEQVEDEIAALLGRREELPVEVTRANLDEEYDREFELREEYRSIQPRLEELEGRREALREEMRQIDRRSSGSPPPHQNDAHARQYSKAAGTAAEERRAFEHLQKQAGKVIEEAVSQVAKQHDQYRGLVESLGMQRVQDPEQQRWFAERKARESASYQEQQAARERRESAHHMRENAARALASRGPRDDDEE